MRYKDNGVPILISDEINLMADEIARDLIPENFEGHPDATDLKVLLHYLGDWHFAGRYLSKDGTLLGLASFNGGALEITDKTRRRIETLKVPPHTILVDRGLFVPERESIIRFTLAHECGHGRCFQGICDGCILQNEGASADR